MIDARQATSFESSCGGAEGAGEEKQECGASCNARIEPRRAQAFNLIFRKIDEKHAIEASRSNDLLCCVLPSASFLEELR